MMKTRTRTATTTPSRKSQTVKKKTKMDLKRKRATSPLVNESKKSPSKLKEQELMAVLWLRSLKSQICQSFRS